MYFTKFIGKHLCQSLFYNKVADPGLQLYQKRDSSTCVFLWILWNSQACYFIKKGILTQVFSCEFYEICKNTFLTEHLRATASGVISNNRFPFNNFVFIICLQKQNMSFLIAIISCMSFTSYRKDKVYFKVGIFFVMCCFFLLIRCCVHISEIELNSLNWIESNGDISLRRV